MEFSAGEVSQGGWDFRGGEDKYLGFVDFQGQKVLEFGPASGFFSFYLESKGAEIVCFDIAVGAPPEQLSLPEVDLAAYLESGAKIAKDTRNSWWYAHAKYNSKAKAVYGNIYDLPPDLGRYDVSTFGCILLHLSNPFAVLSQAAAVTDKAIVVTELVKAPLDLESSYIEFHPGDRPRSPGNWWGLSPGSVAKMLTILGFPEISLNYHAQKHRIDHDQANPLIDVPLFTVVGEKSKYLLKRLNARTSNLEIQKSPDEQSLIDAAIRNEILQHEIEALRSSTSWRLTQPIRTVADALKRWFG
jgi:O-methyltransferase